MQMSEEKFERIVHVSPAYDKRHEGFGIHNAEIFFVLKGTLGAVTFSMGTEWYLPQTDIWLNGFEHNHKTNRKWRPRGNAVSYCSPIQLNEYEQVSSRDCDWIGCACYGDQSFITSDEVVKVLVSKGSDGVWEWLEKWYNDTLVKYNEENKPHQTNGK